MSGATPHITKSVMSEIDDTKIYAEAIGNPTKPAVVFIHGNSFSSGVWDRQFFDELLNSNFYLIRFDLRGHGLSETPDLDSATPFDNPQQASDVAAVLKEFKVTKPVFVSWSYGALIPSDYMSMNGCENVRAIAIIDGVTGPIQDVMKFLTMGDNAAFYEDGSATKQHEAYTKFLASLTHKPLPRAEYLRLRGMLSETHTATRQWIWKRKKDWTVYFDEASRKVPKLVMFGAEDRLNSTAFIDHIKTKWDENLLTVELIDGTGHAPFLEEPNVFNAKLKKWLDSLPSVSSDASAPV